MVADELKTHVELSYMNSSGNSETDTFSLKGDFHKKLDEVQSFKGKTTGLYVTGNDGEEITNKFYIEGEYNHKITDNFFGYLKTNYTAEKFSGFEYRINVGPGIGYQFPIKNKNHNLDLSAGISYSEDKLDSVEEITEDYMSGTTSLKYLWTITDSWKFKQDLSMQLDFEDSENYNGKSVSAIEHKISSLLSLGISYSINYQNNAPADSQDTDKLFLTSLIIDY